MGTAAHEDQLEPFPGDTTVYAVASVHPRVQDELHGQLDAAVAFADFCTYLTDGRAGFQAAQLVGMAESLFETTMTDLRRQRPQD